MATAGMEGDYFVYDNRLASFNLGPKRRVSNAISRARKAPSWPHKYPEPSELAKAGFFFQPGPESPDNVTCFLCGHALANWEAQDDPVEEHLKHAPTCGWAVTSAIEAQLNGFDKIDPRDSKMLKARKATFADRWPHDGSRGWKCKSKQLAEAGWKFTPNTEFGDAAKCTYCGLEVDRWEPSDNPIEEHFRRSPTCPYFEMINNNPPPSKRATKSKAAARGSKVSRMSMQSVATAASDMTSVADAPADHEDSVMTTASVMTQSSKRTARAKRAPAAAKGRKTKAKKDEVVEIHEDANPLAAAAGMPPPPPKPTRGRKRGSDAVEDSVLTNAEAPAPKKRATRAARGSQNAAADASVLTTASHDVDPAAPTAKANTGRKRAATKTRGRKGSAVSVASTASTASLRAAAPRIPTDEELDRQLQADLDRPLTDDEDLAADSESERRKAPAKAAAAKGKKAAAAGKSATAPVPVEEPKGAYAMFDPVPPQPDEAAVDAELQALEAEKAAEENQAAAQGISVPKKGGRKPPAAAGTRKTSKQVKKGKEPVVAPPQAVLEPEPELEQEEAEAEAHQQPNHVPEQPEPADAEEADPATQLAQEAEEYYDATQVHDSSIATVVEGGGASASAAAPPPPKRGRGRPKKQSSLSQASVVAAPVVADEDVTPRVSVLVDETPVAAVAAVAAVAVATAELSSESLILAPTTATAPAAASTTTTATASAARPAVLKALKQGAFAIHEADDDDEPTPRPLPRPPITAAAPSSRPLPDPPATPRAAVSHNISPAPSAAQPVLSPSQSPQSSDAENQPPASRLALSSSPARPPVLASHSSNNINNNINLLQQGQATPVRRALGSPSKQQQNANNGRTIGGVQSMNPWTDVDVEMVFADLENYIDADGGDGDDKENGVSSGGGAAGAEGKGKEKGKGKYAELTSPERRMTVEEWMHHVAGQAEERMKYECEAMVGAFEREGGRAVRCLEGLVVER